MKALRRTGLFGSHPGLRSGISLFVLLLTLAACDFRPLTETANVSYVRIYVDDEILNVTTGFYDDSIREETNGAIDVHLLRPDYQRPEILRVGLFDIDDGTMVAERYLRNQGDDDHGHYYDGYIIIEPGTYNLIAYNFGTESVVVGEEYNCYDMLAYTNEIAPSIKSKLKSRTKTTPETKAGEIIRYDADNLFVSSAERIVVPRHSRIDTLRNADGQAWFDAPSIVKNYYLQIGIVGAEYVASAACLLTGMASSTHLLRPDFEDSQETTLYFELHPGAWPDGYKPGRTDYRCIYTTFGTFGRLPEIQTKLSVSMEFMTTYGEQVDTTFNVSTEFLTEDAIDHQWILPEFTVKIPDPPDPGPTTGSGLAPSVDEWDEVHSGFDI